MGLRFNATCSSQAHVRIPTNKKRIYTGTNLKQKNNARTANQPNKYVPPARPTHGIDKRYLYLQANTLPLFLMARAKYYLGLL